MMESIMHLEAKDHISNRLNIEKKKIKKFFPLHWHEFFELDIVLGGKGYQNLNGTKYPLQKGVMHILRPSDFHDLEVEEPIELYNVMFHESVLSDEFIYILLNQSGNIITRLTDDAFSKVAFMADMLYEEYKGNSVFREQSIENLMESVFFIFMREFKPVYSNGMPNDSPMKKALLYLHMHFREDPPLKTTAEIAGFCPNYFSDMFRHHIGSTYTHYLTNLKLGYAGRLLENCSITSTNLCFECGFSSVSNFLKAFKQHFGVSPQQYAKAHRVQPGNSKETFVGSAPK